MSFVLGIPAGADPAERRTPIVPDVATKLRALGASLLIQRGATAKAHITEHDLGEVTFVDTTEEVMAGSDVVWTIGPPTAEAIAALRGEYKSELLELCLTLGSCILTQAGMAADDAAARAMLEQTITDGSALKKLAEFVAAQDGDPAAIYDPSRLPMAPVQMEVPSPASGYVRHIAATDVGLVSMRLGGGRATKDSVIDHSVGIVLRKKVDEPVTAGESLATIHAADEAAARRAVAELAACYTITPDAPPAEPFIKAIIR